MSFGAPTTKLVLWSLHRTDGLPHLAINLRNVAINAAVVSSVTNSRRTAFTVKDTNMQMYAFVTRRFLTGPDFMRMGPA